MKSGPTHLLRLLKPLKLILRRHNFSKFGKFSGFPNGAEQLHWGF